MCQSALKEHIASNYEMDHGYGGYLHARSGFLCSATSEMVSAEIQLRQAIRFYTSAEDDN